MSKRDIETEEDFAQLAALPGVAGVGPLNRIVLPTSLRSAQELREAAAQLRGDVVLLYTIDTSFHTESKWSRRSSSLRSGSLRARSRESLTTCAAAFIDVRTGFVYGVAEGSATDVRRSSVWATEAAIDAARLKTEREAFAAALKEVGKTWTAINAEHNRTTAALR